MKIIKDSESHIFVILVVIVVVVVVVVVIVAVVVVRCSSSSSSTTINISFVLWPIYTIYCIYWLSMPQASVHIHSDVITCNS